MKNGDKPIANPFVVLREEFDDWAVLFNPDTGRGFGLNPTGVYLWKCLNGERAVDALLEKLCEQANNVPEDASDHISAFVDDLVGQGLAGEDRAQSVWEKLSSSPTGTTSKAVPFNYEPPRLVDLSGGQAASGTSPCNPHGSGASGNCHNGVAACTGCVTTCVCNTGTNTTLQACCYSGGCAISHAACCTGTCDGVSPPWCCSAGTCAGYCFMTGTSGSMAMCCNSGGSY